MRNPKWHRDEIILALDLYFSKDRGSIDGKNPKIIELSRVLNKLPLFPERPDEEKFRNPNGVTLKLSNFLPFDPNYQGKGMTGGSKLDEQIFKEYITRQSELHAIAQEIMKAVENDQIRNALSKVEEDEETMNDSVLEGQVLYRLHKYRERDKAIVTRKKDQVLAVHGKLACEACTFVFEDFYGPIGQGFIECHHTTPLAKLKVATKTTLDSLSLVCSNCHRMLHKHIDTLSVPDLMTMMRHDRVVR
jgi:5-methylcytosine-specific restriction protein A